MSVSYLCLLIWLIAAFHHAVSLIADEDEEVIFEKAFDQYDQFEEKRVTKSAPVCVEEKLAMKDHGSPCLDLLSALHKILFDDTQTTKSEIRAQLSSRDRRDAPSTKAQGNATDEIQYGPKAGVRDTKKSPSVDEGPVFIGGAQNETYQNGGPAETTATKKVIALKEGDGKEKGNLEIEEYKLSELSARSNSTMIWKLSTALTTLKEFAENTSHFKHELNSPATLAAVNRIQSIVGKIIFLPISGAESGSTNSSCQNKTGTDSGDSEKAAGQSTIAGQISESTPVSTATRKVPSEKADNLTTESTPTGLGGTTHSGHRSVGTTAATLLPNSNGSESSDVSSLQNNTDAQKPSIEGHVVAGLQRLASLGLIDWQKKENGNNQSSNATRENQWKKILYERIPQFVPKDNSNLWIIEKRRQQMCVLLSSIDTIRQKCCLTLPIICPEYAAVIGELEKNPDGGGLGDYETVSFERTDLNEGGKRDRKNNPPITHRNVFIADTMARVTSLLSRLMRKTGD